MNQRDLDVAVLHALGESTPTHVLNLAERLGEHPVAIDHACARLHGNGYIESTTRGTYDITDRGQRRLGGPVADVER